MSSHKHHGISPTNKLFVQQLVQTKNKEIPDLLIPVSISAWVPMCFLWLSPESLYLRENKNFEYTHQILDGNNIEPPISENHNRMQIITSFA